MKWNPIKDTDLQLGRVGRSIDHKLQKAEAFNWNFPQVQGAEGMTAGVSHQNWSMERMLSPMHPIQTSFNLQDWIICTNKN